MSNQNNLLEEEEIEATISPEELITAKKELAERCKAADIQLVEDSVLMDDLPTTLIRVGMPCGRDTRWLILHDDDSIIQFLSIPFEKFVFLSDLQAVCSYDDGTIEAEIRPVGQGLMLPNVMFKRLFGLDRVKDEFIAAAKIELAPMQEGLPTIEISPATKVMTQVSGRPTRHRLTLKLTGCHVKTHDSALALLNKVAGAVLFQLDLLIDFPMTLVRERRLSVVGRRSKRKKNLSSDLQYPKTEFDGAPLSLYWYARSAAAMPLFQFLAFYQVIEFYFPIYSKSEAQRKLKAILKDPVFRGDRDADIAKLLTAIQVSRSGAFGDERSQLRATLKECVDIDALRDFLEADAERKDFFLNKAKGIPYHKIPLANPSVDLRDDVAERIYDIRCKIVHTKTESRDGSVELLLPFSKEAEQLSFEIELVQYLAQSVLIAGSLPLHVQS